MSTAMPKFTTIMRNLGLMVHNIKHPEKSQTTETSRTTEEKQINENVTLRRTTIEEIEVKTGDSSKT